MSSLSGKGHNLESLQDSEKDSEKNAIKEVEKLEKEKRSLEEYIEELDKNEALAVIEPYNKNPKKNEKVAKIFSYITSVEFFELYYFILLPVELLTLYLRLTMGVLGRVIYINREFFRPSEKRHLSWYLYRPALGMATALAVFILFRAGQLSFSGSSGAGPSANMNAFMVSFLAVISGLLSEDAYLWIVRAG